MFAIVTINAYAMAAEIHDRMPVIRAGGMADIIGRREGEPATLLKPAADEMLKVWPISKRVNSAQ